MNTSDDDDDNGLWQAYTNSKHLWDQNIVDGEYIIAYEFDPYLHQKLKSMLPKVCLRFKAISVTFNFKGNGKNWGSDVHQVRE